MTDYIFSPAKIWREAKQRYQYLDCQGKILSLTQISTAVDGFADLVPYWVAVIKLENGQKIIGQLVDQGQQPKIGWQVIGVLRRQKKPGEKEVVVYGVKFKIWGR